MDAQERDTYQQPEHGWVCFHCGEVFKTFGGARDHFGARPGDGLACKIKFGDERGLVMELRKAQKKVRQANKITLEMIEAGAKEFVRRGRGDLLHFDASKAIVEAVLKAALGVE